MGAACHTHTQDEINFLKDLYRLHIKLHEDRAKQEQLNKLQDDHNLEHSDKQTQIDILIHWEVTQPHVLPQPLVDNSSQSVLGPTLSKLFMRWCSLLEWPEAPQPAIADPGVTFMELVVSYMIFAQCYLPIKRANGGGSQHYVVPASAIEAEALQITLAEAGRQMAYLMHQMCQLRLPPIVPSFAHAGCKSLYRIGARNQSKGIVCRPGMPCQREMVQLLADIAKTSGAALPQQTFKISVNCDVTRLRSEMRDTVRRKQERVKRLAPVTRRMAGLA